MIELAKGGHGVNWSDSEKGRAGCLMEWKARLCACATCRAKAEAGVKTDSPSCTNPVIVRLVQIVQDRLGDRERQVLATGDWASRVDRCRRTSADRRINVRLAIWLARQVLHLVPEGEDRPRLAIEAAEGWLRGEVAYASAAYAYAAADAAADAAYAAAYAAADLLALLDGCLDQWLKAAADEGVIWEGGDEWEAEFCEFAERWERESGS